MKKRIFAGLLTAALFLGTALAAGEDRFPTVNAYPGYADVKETDWFYDNAKLCYEIGLMNGTEVGFEPNKVLTIAEVSTVVARIRETLTGEPIPGGKPGETWYQRYVDYLSAAIAASQYGYSYAASLLGAPEESATRYQFLQLLSLALETTELPNVNDIQSLPDSSDSTVLAFYNMGILTGIDRYGTFAPDKTLSRAECAAMVSRIARPELRLSFVPEDYSPFTAACLTPDTVMFDNGLPAEEFLITVNNAITAWETALGDDFNWHYVWTDGKSVLTHVKEDSLSALGVTEKQGTAAYRDFDVQVYYSRLIDLLGGPLG